MTDLAIEQALQHLEQGFAIIPIATGGKKPVMSDWPRTATTDPERVKTMLSNPGTRNYGLVMPPEAEDIVVVLDLDDGDGATEPWQERMRALMKEHGSLPNTKAHKTPSGGRHVFFRWPAKTPPKGDTFLGFTMRVLNRRHQVVGPGSSTKQGAYEVASASNDIAELPKEWVEAFKATQTRTKSAPSTPKGTIRNRVQPNGPLITITEAVEGYELPENVPAGGRYSAIRDYVASRWNRGLSNDELWAGVVTVLAPQFDVPLTVDELRERFDRTIAGIEGRLGERAIDKSPDPVIKVSQQSDTEQEAAKAEEPAVFEASEVLLQALPTGDFPSDPGDECYSDLAGQVADELAKQTVASRVGLLVSVLTYAGCVMGVHTYYHGKKPSNPFTTLVGESASGKKTTTMKAVMEALQDDRVFGRQDMARIDGLGSGEGIIGTVRRRVDKSGGFWTGAMISSEMGGQLKVAAREGSILSTVIRQAYDGDSIANITKGSDIEVAGWEYQMGGLMGITPDELRDLLEGGTEVANGFANRFVWVPVREREGVSVPGTQRYTLSDPTATMLKAALTHAVASRGQPMSIDTEAVELLDRYYQFLGTLKGDGGLTRRLADSALRFALARAAIERRDDVTRADVKRSILLTEYARAGLGWVFGAVIASEDAENVMQALVAVGGELKLSQIGPVAFKSKGAGNRVDRALKELFRAKLVESYVLKTSGRSATVIRVADSAFSPLPPPRAHEGTEVISTPTWKDSRDKGKSDDGDRDKVEENVGGTTDTLGETSPDLVSEARRIFAEELAE